MSKISQSIFGVLGAVRFKDRVDFMKPARAAKSRIPTMPQKIYRTTTILIHNRTVCTIEPLCNQEHESADGKPPIHIIYFHGGGYSMEASGLHFALMKTLVKKTGCALSYVDYPLAPEHTATETIAMCFETYITLQGEQPNQRFVLIGDSAGGGLAMALAMKIRDAGIVGPEQMILFSPWLDIALTNGKIAQYEKRDVILDTAALREIGERYRGALPAEHYLVSPKYGDLTGLGKISVFYGTEEILYPDCMEFCEKNRQAGFPVTGYVYEEMQHDWVILPIEEAKRAITEVCELIGGGKPSA